MNRASFTGRDGSVCGFRIAGHSGLAESGQDVLCASVSATAMLVINTLSESYDADLRLECNEETAVIDCEILSVGERFAEASRLLLASYKRELEYYAESYPENIKVQ